MIVAHLGSGASLCALKDGKSVDTTMGFTAVDGLCMGTRPGAIDPGVVLYLFQNLGLSVKEVETILYKKSGLLAISEISNDMRDLLGRSEAGSASGGGLLRLSRARKRLERWLPCWAASMALVFTAGIGENSAEIRQRICEASAWLGIELDDDGKCRAKPRGSPNRESKVSVWVIPTNEELMIARHTGALLGLSQAAANIKEE